MAAVRSRQLARACAVAELAAKRVTQVARDAELEVRGEAHRIEDVGDHAATPVQARLREHRPLLEEVDRQKRLFGTREEHTRRRVHVNA